MADPRVLSQIILERRLLRRRQPGVTSEHDARRTVNESFRREDDDTLTAAPRPEGAGPSGDSSITPPPPKPLAGIDRWHKYSDFRITVSPPHVATSDPVTPDSDAKRTITEAIDFAATWHAALALIYIDPIIEIEVHGGLYAEVLDVTVNYLRFHGIGKPIIQGIVAIHASCTRVLFDNFIIQDYGDDTAPPTMVINIVDGASTGQGVSDIQFRNCLTRGNVMVYTERWSYFDNCEFHYQHTGLSFSPVFVRFRFGMSEWTIFRNCQFKSNGSDDWRSRGHAITIKAIDDFGVWYPNGVTYGSGSFATSGVLLDHCEIDGSSANYGWNLQYSWCRGIQGAFINDTAGSYHHEIHCNSDQGVQAYTWFQHSEIEARYIAHPIDDSVLGTGGTFNIWISHTEHTAPDGGAVVQAGTSVWNTAAPVCTGNVYAAFSNTHAIVWYSVAAVEGANRLLLTGGADSNSVDTAGTQQIFYKQGYQNWP